jgi:hypothetical protein
MTSSLIIHTIIQEENGRAPQLVLPLQLELIEPIMEDHILEVVTHKKMETQDHKIGLRLLIKLKKNKEAHH